MARPAMRTIHGRWSLRQVAAEAGISHRTARTLATNGYLNATHLGYKDILLARVAAALLDAPRPHGAHTPDTPDTTTTRNFEALRLTQTIADNPTPSTDTRLLITPTTATLEADPFDIVAALRKTTDPVLALPIGHWAQELLTLAVSLDGSGAPR